MKALPTQTDEASLLHLGKEAVSLLTQGNFHSLADRFGYALAFGRNLATAIEEELQHCVAEFHASSEPRSLVLPSMSVRYFQQNNLNLFAVVECVFVASKGCPILAELIVTSSGEDKFVSLEQVSLATG